MYTEAPPRLRLGVGLSRVWPLRSIDIPETHTGKTTTPRLSMITSVVRVRRRLEEELPVFSAGVLLRFFDFAYLLSLVCWVGSILFFSFGVAPIIFQVLNPSSAAAFVRALFPRYYLWGAVATAVALPSMLCVPLSYPEFRGPDVGIRALMIICAILIMLYCGNSLTPAINAARDAGENGKARFDQLHKRSVRLNGIALLIGIALLGHFAVRPAPVTNGIVEQSPEKRAQYDREALEEIDRLMKGKPLSEPTDQSLLDRQARDELKSLFEAKQKRDAERKKAGRR